MRFPEEFLHFIWRFNLLNTRCPMGSEGEAIQIIHPGNPNRDAGPDFLQARLMINGTLWVGNVEIHTRSSAWFSHRHQLDPGYDSVILHVVEEHDRVVYRTDSTQIPVLVLRGLFDPKLWLRYENLFRKIDYFPCSRQIGQVDPFIVTQLLTRLAIERLMQKTEAVFSLLHRLKGDWNEAFYRYLGRAFGFKVNADPMEMLVAAVPARLLAKHSNSSLQVEALLFGQAGFLTSSFTEAYPNALKKEYDFLRKKYKLQPLDGSIWKFMRMRPQNFPTLRIAQFAGLMAHAEGLFAEILVQHDIAQFPNLLANIAVNPYWNTHFHFQKQTSAVNARPGRQTLSHLLINVVAVFLFAYGKYTDQPRLMERAIAVLESLPAERNAILRSYKQAGVAIGSALHAQALLQLKKMYCDQKRCLHCAIGLRIIRQGG